MTYDACLCHCVERSDEANSSRMVSRLVKCGTTLLAGGQDDNVTSRHVAMRKKEAPAIDEGEEARLCGGLWTKLLNTLNKIVPTVPRQVNTFDAIF